MGPGQGTDIIALVLALIETALVFPNYFLSRRQDLKKLSSPGPRSLAILPFQNLRQDSGSDYLGYSLADALITKLANVSALTVRPSSAVEKYRDQVIDMRRVAADLNVEHSPHREFYSRHLVL